MESELSDDPDYLPSSESDNDVVSSDFECTSTPIKKNTTRKNIPKRSVLDFPDDADSDTEIGIHVFFFGLPREINETFFVEIVFFLILRFQGRNKITIRHFLIVKL